KETCAVHEPVRLHETQERASCPDNFRAIVHDRCVTKHHRACRRSTSWSVRTAFHGLAFHNIIPATAASHDPHHDPRTHCGAARRDAATRHLRMHRAHRRSAPFRVPAGALASPRMAFGLHRLGWNIGGDAKLCRVVDRLALLLASRTPARRQRRGTGEIERAAYTGTRGMALCARTRGRQGRVRSRYVVT